MEDKFKISDSSAINAIDELLIKLKYDTFSLFTLLKDEDGLEKLKLNAMTKVYQDSFPHLEKWQAAVLYFMRNDTEFKQMINELAEATPEKRRKFFELVIQQRHLS